MANELVSVVIPSYNRPDRTQRAIDSVAAQSFSPIELLVVDDGSSPPLAEDVSLPHEQLTSIELITHNKNQGANVARNTGIGNASGSYLAFLDSDDEWEENKVERQVTKLDSSENKDASYTGVKNVDSRGRLNSIKNATSEGDISKLLLRGNIIGTFSSILVNMDLVEEIGKTEPQLPCYQDWEWYLRMSQETEFAPVSDPLTTRHNEGGQISDNFAQKYEVAYPVIREKLIKYAETEQEKRIAIAGLLYQIGYSALVNGQYSHARRFFTKSIIKYPRQWRSFIYLIASWKHYNLVRIIKRKIVRSLN